MKQFKRILVLVGGGTIPIIGVAMVVLPGPAFIVIPAGLAILAIEFAWARRWLRSARAVLPRSLGGHAPLQKINKESVLRSARFLWRRFYQAIHPKQKVI